MKIYGIIMEINPFHNGHIHFIEEVKKLSNGNPIICIISTNFVQRGEVSVLNKKLKTELLLEYGIDLVLELPMVLANQGGYYFSYQAINILNNFQITDLCFGSESADVEFLFNQSAAMNNASFKDGINSNIGNIKSNDILALNYIKAIKEINPHINIHPLKRISNNYNDISLNNSIASATSIRNNLSDSNIASYLPEKSLNNINNINEQLLINLLHINIQVALDKKLNIFLSENNQLLLRINKYLKRNKYSKIDSLVNDLKDRNNSKYKYQRVILNTILLISDDELNLNDIYYRVIGINSNSFYLLKDIDNYFTSLADIDNSIGCIEKRASYLYHQITNDYSFDEYNSKMIIV